jgi:thiol-disulfide isomerase/thioredoxin
LADAAASGWDPDVFRAVRKASLVAGDSGRALEMAAWLAADPRTAPAFADSVRASAQRRVGEVGWQRELDSARALFVERMLAGASARSLRSDARVRDLDGRAHSVRDLTKGRVTIVAFWSRFCGPAVEALPRMNEVASRLDRVGVPVVSILDEPSSSPALQAFLREQHVTTPVYLDSHHAASRAFNQWGTPYFYVVDGEGRIRFDVTNSPDEALARAEALRLSASTMGAGNIADTRPEAR